jgi:hypothetical protein
MGCPKSCVEFYLIGKDNIANDETKSHVRLLLRSGRRAVLIGHACFHEGTTMWVGNFFLIFARLDDREKIYRDKDPNQWSFGGETGWQIDGYPCMQKLGPEFKLDGHSNRIDCRPGKSPRETPNEVSMGDSMHTLTEREAVRLSHLLEE